MDVTKMPDKIEGECKLKKLTVDDYAIFKGKQEIEFSTDSTNKITVIVGKNATGKTLLYNAIKTCFTLEVSGNKITSKPIIDTTFDRSLISKENEWLFFVSEYVSHNVKIQNYGDDTRVNIIQRMNDIFFKYVSDIRNIKYLHIDENNNLLTMNSSEQIMDLAASEKVSVNLAYILAVKQVCAPKSFLVIDGGLDRVSIEKKKNIWDMIVENSAQVILFCTDAEYQNFEHQYVEKQSVGKEYIIKYNSENNCSEIKKYD